MAIKTVTGYRTISGIAPESLEAYIKAFTFGSGETIEVGRSENLDTLITRKDKTTDGDGRTLMFSAGMAKGENNDGGGLKNILG